MRRQTAKRSKSEKRVIETAGEVFPDGSVIELVAAEPGNENEMRLLVWDGKTARIAPEIEYRGQCYRPIRLHDSIRGAIPLPSRAASFGTKLRLARETAGLFETYVGLPSAESVLATVWVATTWLWGRWVSPCPLLVTSDNMDLAVQLLRVFQCVGRRPLFLSDLSRSTIHSLPMHLRPTLLVNQPDLPPKVCASWRASNYDGIFVPGHRGSVSNVACSKALYLGLGSPADPWGNSAFRIALSPRECKLPPLGAKELAELTNRFQPQWLTFRLENISGASESGLAPDQLSLPDCLGEPDFTAPIRQLVERQEQDARARHACDVNRIIVEVLWVPSHSEPEISVSEITTLANTLLEKRGDLLEFSNEEVGRKMRDLGLYRDRNASGMYLRFSREHRARIHELKQGFRLDLPTMSACSFCPHAKAVAGTTIV